MPAHLKPLFATIVEFPIADDEENGRRRIASRRLKSSEVGAAPTGDGKEDARIEAVYSKLSNKHDPFVVTEELLSCGYLVNQISQPQTATQSCICLLKTIINSKRQKEREKSSNIGLLTGNDIADLVQTLHIDINKP